LPATLTVVAFAAAIFVTVAVPFAFVFTVAFRLYIVALTPVRVCAEMDVTGLPIPAASAVLPGTAEKAIAAAITQAIIFFVTFFNDFTIFFSFHGLLFIMSNRL
jgi:hypothetical protein